MPESDLDRDLQSIHQARSLARAASAAQERLEDFDQEQVDRVVEAMAAAGSRESERLARAAHEETGYGSTADKKAKNDFVLEQVVDAMRGMRTVGILRQDRAHGVYEIAEPVGVVAGIIPSTNPTSTAIFKCLIAIKARCAIVLSPHPAARECVRESADVMRAAAVEAGCPGDAIGCITQVSMDGTRELMNGDDTDLILATGGIGLVKAAYSAGKPAYGVGPGNVPAYIERSAGVDKAVADIFDGTTFDNGTLCSSEQSIVCDREVAEAVRSRARELGGHFLSRDEVDRLGKLMITDELLVDPDYVGRPATAIAAAAGIEVPEGTRVLICPLDGVGPEEPLSREKLSPVLAYYEVDDWREGCRRCTELLRFGGLGHTLAIHSRNDEVILEFGLQKPAHRVLVNTVAAIGAVGYTTNLFPSMTLGCGSWGNNITSDNIGPQHLVNVKRLAYEARPYRGDREAPAARGGVSPVSTEAFGGPAGSDLERQVDDYLARRGLFGDDPPSPPGAGRTTVTSVRDEAERRGSPDDLSPPSSRPRPPGSGDAAVAGGDVPQPPRARTPLSPARHEPSDGGGSVRPETRRPEVAEFVAEEDVRTAIETGEQIRIGPDTILTPSARELGEQHGTFQKR